MVKANKEYMPPPKKQTNNHTHKDKQQHYANACPLNKEYIF